MTSPLTTPSGFGPILGFFLADPKKPIVITPEHLDFATQSLWMVVAAVVVFFALRPELWRRLAIGPVDPRPIALTRIFFGITIFWTLLDLTMWGEILFTDQGMYTTEAARKRFGGPLRTAWDPEVGFENWWEMVKILGTQWTVLHVRSDPAFVYAIYGFTFASVSAMILGYRTRLATFLTFVGVMQIYNYTPIWFAGGDTVTRCMLVLGVFAKWGEAYSLDTWLRRRRAILGGAEHVPALRPIPAWPGRLMMLQLAIIYCATGLLKSGHTWGFPGTAIYYAINLDHFYRVPMTGFSTLLYRSQILRIQTWVVHWWECLFPLALLGVALGAWERTRDIEPDPEGDRGQKRDFRYRDVGEQPWGRPPAWRRVASWVVFGVGWLLLSAVAGLAAQYHYDVHYLPTFLRVGPENLRVIAQVAMVVIPVVAVAAYGGIKVLTRRGQAAIEKAGGPDKVGVTTRAQAGASWFVIHWLLGKRIWLGLGTAMHLGIAVLLNVGTFVHVMLSVYPVWMTGGELDRLWWYLGSKPASPGEAGRTADKVSLPRRVYDRYRYRVPADHYVVVHGTDEKSIRRAALLRCWDLTDRLRFESDDAVKSEKLTIRTPEGERFEGGLAGAVLTNLLPGLWLFWLPGFFVEQVIRPLGILPDSVRGGLGWFAARVIDQRP